MALKIYKASAGSGKTYQLTEEYLKLALANPDKYKRILAITFTNKATEEMKSRILKELFNLSSGKDSPHLSTLSTFFNGLSANELQNRAKIVLNNILYDYNHFNISTIDSFFQRIRLSFSSSE